MLKEDAGTQNEDRIGTKTNEEVGKTRSEDKTDTKTKVGAVSYTHLTLPTTPYV